MNLYLRNRLRNTGKILRERGFVEALRHIRDRINKTNIVQFSMRQYVVPFRIHHVSGSQEAKYGSEELVAVTVMRNGAAWAAAFLDHHRGIGVKHFIVLDNGSTDGSPKAMGDNPDVTILRTNLPYHAYENTMKRYLVNRFCAGRWCLFVDIDELFDYPHSDRVGLSSLLNYLNKNDYTAVATQMLDFFSDRPLGQDDGSSPDFRASHQFYSLSDIHKSPYRSDPNGPIKAHQGGIRLRTFGTSNGLTKVSLFRLSGGLQPFVDWHHVKNGHFADFSAVLLHYPFVGSFADKVGEAVASGRYGHLTNDEYRGYQRRLESPHPTIVSSPDARAYQSANDLIEDEFLVASVRFEEFAAAQAN